MNYSEYGILVSQFPEFFSFIDFSERAIKIYVDATVQNKDMILNMPKGVFNNLFFQAKNTSYSIRLLGSWGQPLEALALLRIRLEQLIISSYLIHENQEIGIKAYLKYYPNIEKKVADNIKQELNLNSFLKSLFPEFFKMIELQLANFDKKYENFDFENDKPEKKWTKKSIYKLAETRDKLINEENIFSSIKLVNLYKSLYQTGSCIVHCDVSALSENFVTVSKDGILTPQIFHIFSNIMSCALLDIIQCYEHLSFYGIDRKNEIKILYNDYVKEIIKILN